ncbi:MAG: hypothetical protein HYY18_22230 [Planctomycetes bacterium]|nr:hypothetical protein [Planctomycetota bacterium]
MNTLTVAPPCIPNAFKADREVIEAEALERERREEGRVFFVVTGVLSVVMFALCVLAIASMAMAISLSQ